MAEVEKCPECKSTYIISDPNNGEVVCGRCGLVISEKAILNDAEWRSFTLEEELEKSRVGAPPSLLIHDKGLTTVLNPKASRLKPEAKRRMSRMRKLQVKMRAYSATDKNLAKAMSEIDRISASLNLPASVKEEAALIYRKAFKMKVIKGRSISSMAAASIYVACRKTGLPRTLKMIEAASGLQRKEIARNYRLLIRTLGFKMPAASPVGFMSKIVENLEIPREVQAATLKILKEAKGALITAGRDPRSLIGAAIYMASKMAGLQITQADVAAAAGITEVTIRNCCKMLSQILEERNFPLIRLNQRLLRV
jgi:transcription initiation factor TFIIB